ncbi:techylectin-like protein [Caerostris darwini]|uniref:Techylectin-like protein n=1 Tax=Caerostris darwini TaxID=1538125 RepID=A0AAV4QAI4_9ARAC|nr:techylectin-like protein [Caerostris darwini]
MCVQNLISNSSVSFKFTYHPQYLLRNEEKTIKTLQLIRTMIKLEFSRMTSGGVVDLEPVLILSMFAYKTFLNTTLHANKVTLKGQKIEALKPTMCHFVYSTLFLFLTFSQTFVNGISTCDHNDISTNYLDTAMDMISNAKTHLPNCPNALVKPMDCAEVVAEDKPLDVYCDMDTDGGGWTVFQRRGNFLKPKDYFYKDWVSYKKGFGHIDKDFWLGNDNLYALSNQRLYSIRFDLRAVDGETRYALYETFWIDDENHKYTLHIQEYSGDAGDSMISQHNNMEILHERPG